MNTDTVSRASRRAVVAALALVSSACGTPPPDARNAAAVSGVCDAPRVGVFEHVSPPNDYDYDAADRGKGFTGRTFATEAKIPDPMVPGAFVCPPMTEPLTMWTRLWFERRIAVTAAEASSLAAAGWVQAPVELGCMRGPVPGSCADHVNVRRFWLDEPAPLPFPAVRRERLSIDPTEWKELERDGWTDGGFVGWAFTGDRSIEVDAGELAWARQVIPALLGRRAESFFEVKALADLADAIGRKAAARRLIDANREAFTEHWFDLLSDEMRVQRTPNNPALSQAPCFGDALPKASDPLVTSGDLARFVHGSTFGTQTGPAPFNMAALVRSAIALDNLAPIYRGYVYALAARPPTGNQISEQNKRDELGILFSEALLNRNLNCVTCHNGAFSTTGPSSGWNRHFPLFGRLEEAANLLSAGPESFHAVFRTDLVDGPAAKAPFGMVGCGRFSDPEFIKDDPEGKSARIFGIAGPRASVWQLEHSLARGVWGIDLFGVHLFRAPDGRILDQDIAFAYMVATNVVDRVWADVMGYPLTIATGFQRTPQQRELHRWLVDDIFLANNFLAKRPSWSLRNLLVEIVASPYFNRQPPRASGRTYDLPPVFEPWTLADPREGAASTPATRNNSVGDGVHRHLVGTLVRAAEHALGWPSTQGFAPNPFEVAVGKYEASTQAGTRGSSFIGLIEWETRLGSCQPPAGAARDFVRKLAEQAWADDFSAGVTLRMLVWSLQDRLISDARFPKEMEPALEAHFGIKIDDRVGDLGSIDAIEAKLRGLCGVLLSSPQFQLAGLANGGFAPPPLVFVCDTPPCSYVEHCQRLLPSPNQGGACLACGKVGLEKSCKDSGAIAAADAARALCPAALCRYSALVPPDDAGDAIVRIGPDDPQRATPPFDVRGGGTLGLGRVSPFDLGRGGLMLRWGEGGRVRAARGVRLLPAGARDYVDLDEGHRLAAGDLLEIPGGAELAIDFAEQRYETPPGGFPPAPALPGQPSYLLVTGPSALTAATLPSGEGDGMLPPWQCCGEARTEP